MPGIPAAARLGSRLQGSQPLTHWGYKHTLHPFFVHCRGRRRGGPGKSTKNLMQVRPSLSSSGDSFPNPHFTNSTALAQREGRVCSCEPSGPGPSMHLTSQIPFGSYINSQEDQQKPIDIGVVCRPTKPPPPLLALLIASLSEKLRN